MKKTLLTGVLAVMVSVLAFGMVGVLRANAAGAPFGATLLGYSPSPADTSMVVNMTLVSGSNTQNCGSATDVPWQPQQLTEGTLSYPGVEGPEVMVDGNYFAASTWSSFVQTQVGTTQVCNDSAHPYSDNRYSASVTLNTAALSNGSHTFGMCFWGVNTGGSSGYICEPGQPFTVQHAAALPGIGLTRPTDAVTDPVTAAAMTQTSVENVGGTSMYWNSSPNLIPGTLYNYTPCSSNGSCGPVTMLPKWLNVAMAQTSGLPAGSSTPVNFTYDHRYASTSVSNIVIVPFNCSGECNPVSAQYSVTYTVPGPSISQQSGTQVSAGSKTTLSWKATNYNSGAHASSAMCITGGGFGSGTGTCYPADNNATQQLLSGPQASVIGSAQDPGSITKTTTYTLTLRGLSDVDNSPENFDIETVTVTPSASPLTCVATGPTTMTQSSVGQSVSFSLLAAGGSGSYAWTSTGGSPWTSTTGSFTVTLSTPGSHPISLIDTAPGGSSIPCPTLNVIAPASSNSATLLINGGTSPVTLSATTASWTVSLTSSEISKNFTEYFSFNGGAFYPGPSGNSTDQNGSYSTEGATGSTWAQNDAGTWKEYVEFADGTISNTITYTVSASATLSCSLNASPTQVSSGGTATLTWSSTSATSCTGSEGGSTGWNNMNLTPVGSGSWTTPALAQTTEFSMSCSNGTASAVCTNSSGGTETTVSVSGPQPPSGGAVTCSPSNQDVLVGQSANFTVTGGDGSNYSWLAAGAAPSSGSGSSFSDSYGTTGEKWVSVTSGGNLGQCEINVIVGNGACSPNGSTTPCMSGGNGCGMVNWGTETCTNGEWGLVMQAYPPTPSVPLRPPARLFLG